MASSVAHASFPNFPVLPFEIRLKIWELCLPGPRIIQLRDTRTNLDSERDPILRANPCHCAALCDAYSSIAAASSESRSVFLAHFTFCFGTHVSWKYDTIYLNWELSNQPHQLDFGPINVLDGFEKTILAAPGGDQMASLAVDIHWNGLSSFVAEKAYHTETTVADSLFERFPSLTEFVLVHGTIGIFDWLPVEDCPPDGWPDYQQVSMENETNFRAGSYTRINPADICQRWPLGGGIKFVEANTTDETVWIGDPTYVAEDYVRDLYEDAAWGVGEKKPPIKIVALKVLTGTCFKDSQQDSGKSFEGRRQLREDIEFQKNWRSTC